MHQETLCQSDKTYDWYKKNNCTKKWHLHLRQSNPVFFVMNFSFSRCWLQFLKHLHMDKNHKFLTLFCVQAPNFSKKNAVFSQCTRQTSSQNCIYWTPAILIAPLSTVYHQVTVKRKLFPLRMVYIISQLMAKNTLGAELIIMVAWMYVL